MALLLVAKTVKENGNSASPLGCDMPGFLEIQTLQKVTESTWELLI